MDRLIADANLLTRLRAWANQTQAVEMEVAIRVPQSSCMTRRRQRSFQAWVRSTTQPFGSTAQPMGTAWGAAACSVSWTTRAWRLLGVAHDLELKAVRAVQCLSASAA